MSRARMVTAALVAMVVLAFAAAIPAFASNNSQQSGLVNVSVGDVSVLNNANIGVAANVAASLCGVSVGPVALLAVNTATTGTQNTVCSTASGPVTLSQA